MATNVNMLILPSDLREMSEGAVILCSYLHAESSGLYTCTTLIMSDENVEFSDTAEALFEKMKSGWFPFSVQKIRDDIAMSAPRQSKYLMELVKKGLIEVTRRGCPSRRWICCSKLQKGE